MSIQITCPAGHLLNVSDGWSGKAGRCPICKAMLQVPGDELRESDVVVAEVTDDENFDLEMALAHSNRLAQPTAPENRPLDVVVDIVASTTVDHVTSARLPPPLPPQRPIETRAEQPVAAAADNTVTMGQVKPSLATPTSPPLSPMSVPPPLPSVLKFATELLPPLPLALRPKRGFRASPEQHQTVRRIASAMAAYGLVCVAPAVTYINLADAPNWARALWMLTMLQWAYASWVVSTPDWASLWTAMIWHTLVGAAFGTAMAIAMTTPLSEAVVFGMTDIRQSAPLWCAAMVGLSFGVAYWSGRTAWRWQRTVGAA